MTYSATPTAAMHSAAASRAAPGSLACCCSSRPKQCSLASAPPASQRQKLAPRSSSILCSRSGAAAATRKQQQPRWPTQRPQRQQHQQHQQRRGRLLVTAAVKINKGKQILCNKTLRAREGQAAEVERLCQGVAEFSRQRMAEGGSGILAFEVSQVRRPPARPPWTSVGWCGALGVH